DISRGAICYGFFMRLLKRVIVVVLLGVILFMVRDDIRYVYQLGFFILSIATATVNYRLSGISLLVGLLFIIWKFSVTVLFLFTP
ncbi:hypothetical protein MJM83_30235, partial [Salmonella enterica subsp. enterica serovar Montevideo]|nr:hypothetical protein [Salmonella enterica subsp. enterica serovar Montevideo]